MKVIGLIARLLGAAVLAVLAGNAAAQASYPSRPIRFVTPYAPGGSTSVTARLVAQHLTERWGQNVIVDNRPGGNTVIGTDIVAKSPPDGYTILLTPVTHSMLSSLMKTPYDPVRDFAPVATIGISPQVLVLNPGVPANTVQEVIGLAKAKPGQLNFASSGAGGTSHLAGEVFNMLAGVKTQHIPYKGGALATMDVIGGHVQMFYSVPVNIIGHVRSGKLKAIAVTGENRLASMSRVPTFTEAGLKGFDVKTWHAVTAPAATPKPIVDKLSVEIGALLSMPATRDKLDSIGMTPMISTPEQFAAMLKSEMSMYAKVIKAANLRID